MKKLFFLFWVSVFMLVCTAAVFATDTVYLDGTGKTAGAYTDFAKAVAALPNGGTVIVSGDTQIGTSTSGPTIAAVGGKITVKGENGAKFIFARSLTVNSEFEFDDIIIHSTATASGNFIAKGNTITMGAGVTVTKADGAIYPAIFGGAGSGTVTYDSHVIVRGGRWRSLWGGNYGGTFKGNSVLEISGAVCDGNLSAENYQGTFSGTSKLIVDLRGGKPVTAGTYKQTPTVLVDDGYRAVLTGKTYSQELIPEAPTTVYVDGTGKDTNAYPTLEAGINALHENGGTVILTGDTKVGTSTAAATMPAKSGKVTVTAQNGAKLIIMRTVYFSCDMEFTNMTFHSGATEMGNVLARGHDLTFTESVVTSRDDGCVWLALFGGTGSGTVTYDTHLTVRGGTWRAIYGANYTGTYSGHSVLEVSGVVSMGTVSARNYEGTHKGTFSLTFDLRNGKTVTAGTYKEIPTLLVDNGYEGIQMDNTYTQRKITSEAPKTVFVDGTGATEGAYPTLAAAVADMPAGGTIVIAGNTEIAEDTVFPKTGALVITSVYGDADYTRTAKLQFAANLTLGAETTFRDITIERTKLSDGNLFIIAAGNPLTVDTGVICLNYTGKQNLSLVGGYYNMGYTGDSHVTVKSGHFRNLYGGNQYNVFQGDSHVTVTGGSFDNSVVGASFNGDFHGNVYLTFAGSASLLNTSTTQGIVGGIMGDGGSTAVTMTGDVHMTLGGTCGINHNVIGASRNKNAYSKGNVELTIEDDAYAFYSVYAGGYINGVDGNTRITVNGGDFNGSLFGGAHSGTVTGDTYIEINRGKLCYYRNNIFSSMSDIAGTKNVYGGGESGSTVNGSATIVMNGGSIYGDIYGGSFAGESTVSGTSKVTVTNGLIFGKISADAATIDLSAGGCVEIGVSSSLSKLIGGGSLILAPAAKLTVGTLSGTTALSINGLPLPVEYVKATTVADGAAFHYAAQDNETLLADGGSYSIGFEGAYTTTEVTVKHQAGFTVLMRAGRLSSVTPMTADATTDTTATYTLTPGLYNVTVYATDNRANYRRKALYVDGRSETYTLTMDFDPVSPDGFDYKTGYFHSDEMIEKYYQPMGLAGFKMPDTPYFNKRFGTTSSIYTTNDELVEFLAEKAATCDYMYVYNIATSPYGYAVPLVLFTKDAIPEGATLAEAAAIVRKTEGRDILMINGGTHGNEPTGTEGTLFFISELCGEYGETVFDGTNIGAIVVTPRLNPDGFKVWTREVAVPNPVDNLNRDFMALSAAETTGIVNAYYLFMPTFSLDCHEALANPLWSDGQFTTDIYDAGIHAQTNLNGPYDPLSVVRGDRAASFIDPERVALDVLEDLRTQGLRTYYYETITRMVNHNNYFGLSGTYAYLLEIPGITGGESNMARRTYAQLCGIRTFVQTVMDTNGEMARTVEAARASLSASAQVYDGETPVILDSARSRAELRRFEWNNPLIAADTTVRVQDNLTYMYDFDTAVRYRTLPTAYVFPSSVENLSSILALLDKHHVAYKALAAGTTLTLQPYSGSASAATLGEKTDVTFAEGAYLVPVEGANVYVTALLFEPDVPDSEGFLCSLAQMELLPVTDLYRSTESYIAAKHGMDGYYYAIGAREKEIASVTADGLPAATVTDGGYTVLATPKYSLTVTYTDGTSETVTFGDLVGDMNGDGKLSIADVLLLIRAILNEAPAADVNGDGRINLADVIRLMKQIA